MPSAPSSAESAGGRSAYVRIALLTLLALALRWPLLDRSVWFDEACMSHQRVGTWEQLVATVYVDIHPPLYLVLMHAWNALFGDSELSLRMLPLLCGLASIPALAWAGRPLVGERGALFAALLLALSPVHAWYSAEARLYSPMLLCALLAVGAFHRLIQGQGSRWLWALHALNLAVMCALHYYLAVYVLLLAALLPVFGRGQCTAARRLFALHAAALAALGVFVLAKRALGTFETAQDYMRALTLPELYGFVFQWSWTGNTLPALDGDADAGVGHAFWYAGQLLGVLVIALGLRAVARGARERPVLAALPLYALAVPGFLMAAALAGLGNTYIERSALTAVPFLFLIAGAGVESVRSVSARRALAAGVVLLFCASSLALHAQPDAWTVYKPNPDWRAVARYLGAELDAGAAGRPVFTSMPNPRPLPYYDARIQDVKNLLPADSPEGIERKVSARMGAALGAYAGRTFAEFERQKRALLDGAQLRVYNTGDGTLENLDLASRSKDDVFYLVREHFHPPGDTSVQRVLAEARVEVLEAHNFTGISAYKVRLRP